MTRSVAGEIAAVWFTLGLLAGCGGTSSASMPGDGDATADETSPTDDASTTDATTDGDDGATNADGATSDSSTTTGDGASDGSSADGGSSEASTGDASMGEVSSDAATEASTDSAIDSAPDAVADAADAACTNDPACTAAGGVCKDTATLLGCARGTDGCLHVTSTTACPAHQSCGGSAGTAACACIVDPTCTAAGAICTSSTQIETCSTDANGCLYVSAAASTCTTSLANATASCSGNACTATCDSGFHACGSGASETCASNTSTQSCGSSCTPCTAPANATPTCDGTSCGFTCNTNYVAAGGACVAPATRPVAPITGNAVSTRTPTLSWALPPGFGSTHVDVCLDHSCSNVIYAQDVTGTRLTLPTTLPVGRIFWRLTTLDGAARSPLVSPVWSFAVLGTHSAPRMTSWPSFFDVENDGYADFVVKVLQGGGFVVQELPGSSSGVTAIVESSAVIGNNASYSGGDVNGDGYGDIVMPGGANALSVFLGSPTGFPTTASLAAQLPSSWTGAGAVVGDVDADGYADFVAITTDGTNYGVAEWNGSPSGFVASSVAFALPSGATASEIVYATGDVNADGYADVLVANYGYGTTGRAWLYEGSASGLSSTPAFTVLAPAGSGYLGYTGPSNLGTASSDVNGDGWLDLLVDVDNVNGTAGGVAVYYGSASGFGISPSVALPSGANLYFAGGGDVNGDGYGDVVTSDASGGAVNVHVYDGSATGISTTATQTVSFGAVGPINPRPGMALLGDVNGDGRSDYAFDNANSANTASVIEGSSAISGTPAFTYNNTCTNMFY